MRELPIRACPTGVVGVARRTSSGYARAPNGSSREGHPRRGQADRSLEGMPYRQRVRRHVLGPQHDGVPIGVGVEVGVDLVEARRVDAISELFERKGAKGDDMFVRL